MNITPISKNFSTRKLDPSKPKKNLGQEFKAISKENKISKFLIAKEKLVSLASELKEGKINYEEANSKFVGLAIENSLTIKDKDLLKAVEDIFKNDPEFNNILIKNLKRLK